MRCKLKDYKGFFLICAAFIPIPLFFFLYPVSFRKGEIFPVFILGASQIPMKDNNKFDYVVYNVYEVGESGAVLEHERFNFSINAQIKISSTGRWVGVVDNQKASIIFLEEGIAYTESFGLGINLRSLPVPYLGHFD